MSQGPNLSPETAATLAAQIIVAFLQREVIDPKNLPELVYALRIALGASDEIDNVVRDPTLSQENELSFELRRAVSGLNLNQSEAEKSTFKANTEPAVPIEDSIHDDYLISLEDGKKFRSLRRHLMAKHGMTPDDYRAKWNLPPDYPMVAPSYARERSAVAKRTGLGQSRSTEKSNSDVQRRAKRS